MEGTNLLSAHAIANKFRRALRNGTGATFTNEQLKALAGWGVLVELSRIEANELCPISVTETDAAAASVEAPRPSTPKGKRVPKTGVPTLRRSPGTVRLEGNA